MKNDDDKGFEYFSGFCVFLTLVFILLKLTGAVDWAWTWVLAPLWVPIVMFCCILAIVFGVAIIVGLFSDLR